VLKTRRNKSAAARAIGVCRSKASEVGTADILIEKACTISISSGKIVFAVWMEISHLQLPSLVGSSKPGYGYIHRSAISRCPNFYIVKMRDLRNCPWGETAGPSTEVTVEVSLSRDVSSFTCRSFRSGPTGGLSSLTSRIREE
jgi:hypothetical protein